MNRATASDILLVSYNVFQGTAHNSMINIINFSITQMLDNKKINADDASITVNTNSG